LLELLDVTGCLVTIDAIGTQTEIAKMIVERGGDYLLPVKENQGQLYEDLEKLFSIEEREGFITPGYTLSGKWTIIMAGWRSGNAGLLRMQNVWITCEERTTGNS
jgi:hypothetical protein